MGDDDDDSDGEEAGDGGEDGSAGEDDEDEIQKEIRIARERKLRERKKIKKKERKLLAKKRRHAAFGMDLNAIDVQEHDQFFSLSALNSKSTKDLNDVAEVNLDRVTTEQAFGKDSDDDDSDDGGDDDYRKNKGIPDKDEDTGYSYRLDRELDMAYDRFITTTKNGEAKIGTKTAKRSKKLLRERMAQQSHEDHELVLTGKKGVSQDAKRYAKLLQGPQDSDDSDDDVDSDGDQKEEGDYEDDDGFDNEPMTPAEHQARKKQKKADKSNSAGNNPMIHEFPDDPTPMKTARWFSNPLFAEIGQTVNAATTTNNNGDKNNDCSRDIDPLVDNDNDEDKMIDAADAEAKAKASLITIAPSLIPPTSSTTTSTKKKKNTKSKKDTNSNNKMKDTTTNKVEKKEKKITADDVLAM